MTRREYTAGSPTTLAAAFNVGNPDFTITSATNWPTSTNYDFFVTIDAGTAQEERVLCSARTGTTVTVATGGRGKDGTGEKNHAAGATVWPSWSAQDADEANAHINSTGYATESAVVHGLGSGDGVVVGTDKSQTLTNKTINSANNTMTVAQSAVTNLTSDLSLKAPLANPTFTGTVSGVTKSMVGLANVDNTSDANKPISTATQAALDGKSGTAHGHAYLSTSGGTISGSLEVQGVVSAITNTGAGRGLHTRQPAGDTDPALIQFTNNAANVQLASLGASAAGQLTATASVIYLSSNNAYWNGVYNTVVSASANVLSSSDMQLRRTSSSARYKKDIETLEHEVADRVLDLRPVWFKAKESNTDNPEQWSYVGLIAEEVAEVEPRLVFYKTVEVNYDENGNVITDEEGKPTYETLETPVPESVQYEKIAVYLLDIVKREKARSNDLEQRLIALEAKLNSL